jgi:small subunit ribosomal protein S8
MPIVNDPIGDLLTRMRNAQGARKSACSAPWSRIKEQLCEVLKREGWIAGMHVSGEMPFKELRVTFIPGKVLTLKRISKPGRRVYAGSKELRPVLRGYGMAVLTTSKGLLTGEQAIEQKVGGEVLCTVS